LRLPKHIKVHRENWVRMMYCMKHLMKLHPEYQEMIYPFYSEMYDKYPYNENDPFNFEDDYKVRPRTSIERELDKLADLNNKEKDNPHDAWIHSEDQHMDEQEFESGLNQLIWDLGMKLPSWDDNKDKGNKND